MKKGALIQNTEPQPFLGHGWSEVAWGPLATAVVYDLGGPWFNPARPQRLTVPKEVGWVQVAANLALDERWAGHAVMRIAKNGAAFPGQPGLTAGEGIYWSRLNLASAPLQVVAGDCFTVEVNHNLRGENRTLGLAEESWFAAWAVD